MCGCGLGCGQNRKAVFNLTCVGWVWFLKCDQETEKLFLTSLLHIPYHYSTAPVRACGWVGLLGCGQGEHSTGEHFLQYLCSKRREERAILCEVAYGMLLTGVRSYISKRVDL